MSASACTRSMPGLKCADKNVGSRGKASGTGVWRGRRRSWQTFLCEYAIFRGLEDGIGLEIFACIAHRCSIWNGRIVRRYKSGRASSVAYPLAPHPTHGLIHARPPRAIWCTHTLYITLSLLEHPNFHCETHSSVLTHSMYTHPEHGFVCLEMP